ncbi:MAG: efflux RND transporter permease subunit, partial [Bacteroidota bacterium]
EADAAHEGVSVSDITSELKNKIVPGILKDHAAVSVAYEGQNREQEKSRKSMGQILPIILILMFAMVVFTFRSFSQSLLVFLLIPLGFIGVVFGHWLHGHQISLFSILGLIALIGIIINDSLVLIGALNVLLKEGKSFMEAVYEASVSRFRPILLTSITTIAGLAPLILEKGFQAQFLVPMAITIAYGLLVGTLLLLIVLPVLLVMANRFKIAVRWLWTGTRPTAESVERAVREINRPHAES